MENIRNTQIPKVHLDICLLDRSIHIFTPSKILVDWMHTAHISWTRRSFICDSTKSSDVVCRYEMIV